jgi:hypothetical protein
MKFTKSNTILEKMPERLAALKCKLRQRSRIAGQEELEGLQDFQGVRFIQFSEAFQSRGVDRAQEVEGDHELESTPTDVRPDWSGGLLPSWLGAFV